jgi:acetyl-CoA C-acetyltransferase
MFLDGLEDAFDKGRLMGTYAEDTAQHYQFTREVQDAFAAESLKRAKAANEDGTFAKEIASVTVKARSGPTNVTRDEQPFTADPAKIPKLKPAFRDGGTVTAANSSSISDGAAALVLMRASEAKRRRLEPLARIVGVSSFAQAPAWFTTAPVAAIKKLLERQLGCDVGLYEINEAFATAPCAPARTSRCTTRSTRTAVLRPAPAVGASARIRVTLLAPLRSGGTKGPPCSASAAARPPPWRWNAWLVRTRK